MFKVVVFFVVIAVTFCDNVDELLSVVVIYRHGDRTPVDPYPTDPYRNASYWPVDWGQLTNTGKLQQYYLGKWLRARYDGFLPKNYSDHDIYIRSTDFDRTLMSAESNLAGLYPPPKSQIWNLDIPWQPIPVHTAPKAEDTLVAMKKNCPKYQKLSSELFKTDFFQNISHKNHDLYAYLTKNAGTLVSTLEDVEYLYNTLFIETLYNLTLPPWTKPVYPSKMKYWAELSFATSTWTPALARLKTGTLFNEIIEHFANATKSASDYRKFLVFSAHDNTIANILNTFGAFEYHCPPYASTILIELRQNTDNLYVNIFYKNSSQLRNVIMKGCNFDCNFNDFTTILKPISLTQQEWELECQLSWIYYLRLDNFQYLIFIMILLSIVSIILTMLTIIKFCKRIPKEGTPVYMQLPNDEVA